MEGEELELDIETVSSTLLWHIYDMVMKYSPEVHEAQKKSMEEKLPARTLAKPAQKKKNKPMSKNEQERNIEHLENLTAQFERQNSGSTEPIRSEFQ
jgi:bromodomain-containing factor 1